MIAADGWILRMVWENLLFAHWQVDPDQLRPFLPPGLSLDLFSPDGRRGCHSGAGRAYVAVVPFFMSGVSPRGFPNVPGLHRFPELNLRTYVVANGVPGVWFFSLDAGQMLAVRLARRFFHLPYFDAEFEVTTQQSVAYQARRTHRGQPHLRFRADYRPTGESFVSQTGTLEHWLTERYYLYSANAKGELFSGRIQHQPWPLFAAEATIYENELAQPLGIDLSGPPESLLYAPSLSVKAHSIQKVT
jgi:uncharacterized protein